ncbi:hypothetical protein AAGW05_14175 [Arthrobacter sp. LAPM80]|uniref:hypothetical protein n=1 Tax=Arthrobacter sp. LAPM80 TaxID=3141788 RepID=UPI00398A83A0
MVMESKQPLHNSNPGAGISVVTESSSQHPCDWGRALACAVSQLVEQIIDTAGIDPSHEPAGLDLSLHLSDLPGGKRITATWQPDPSATENSSSAGEVFVAVTSEK